MSEKEKDSLVEWYEMGPGPIGMDQTPMPSPNDLGSQIAIEEPKKIEEPKPVNKEKKLEQYGELYKAMVLTRAIEKKLSNFSYKRDEDDMDEIKTETKDLVKKLGDIVNGL